MKYGDGRLELFAVGTNGVMYRNQQRGPGGDFAAQWVPLSTYFTATERVVFDPLTTRPSVIWVEDRLWVFARTTSGRIVYTRQEQHATTSGWLDKWFDLGSADQSLPGNPDAAPPDMSGGVMTVFVRDANGAVRIKTGWTSDSWNVWRQWPPGGILMSDPIAYRSWDETGDTLWFLAFAVGLNGHPFVAGEYVTSYRERLSEHGAPIDWTDLGAGQPVGARVANCARLGLIGGRNLIWRGIDNKLWRRDVTAGTTYGGAYSPSADVASDPAVAGDEIFWVNSRAELIRQRDGRPLLNLNDVVGSPVARTNANRGAEVFFRRGDMQIHRVFQSSPSAAFTY